MGVGVEGGFDQSGSMVQYMRFAQAWFSLVKGGKKKIGGRLNLPEGRRGLLSSRSSNPLFCDSFHRTSQHLVSGVGSGGRPACWS